MPATISPVSASSRIHEFDAPRVPRNQELEVQEKFQEFVAGTFYKQMLKALRSTQGKPAYFHGGQAEDVFQGQLDQYITDALAKQQGAQWAEPLFETYQRQIDRVV